MREEKENKEFEYKDYWLDIYYKSDRNIYLRQSGDKLTTLIDEKIINEYSLVSLKNNNSIYEVIKTAASNLTAPISLIDNIFVLDCRYVVDNFTVDKVRYRIDYPFVLIKNELIPNINDIVIREVEESNKYRREIIDKVEKVTKEYFGEDKVFRDNGTIYIHYPEITIRNRENLERELKDVYIKITNFNIKYYRHTYNLEEIIGDYSHSHVSGIPTTFHSMCLGSGEFKNFSTVLNESLISREEIDYDDIEGWVYLMDNYLKWENIDNPHRYMRDIIRTFENNVFRNNNGLSIYTYEGRITDEFLDTILNYCTIDATKNIKVNIEEAKSNSIFNLLTLPTDSEGKTLSNIQIKDLKKNNIRLCEIDSRIKYLLGISDKFKVLTDNVVAKYLRKEDDNKQVEFPERLISELVMIIENKINDTRRRKQIEDFLSKNTN